MKAPEARITTASDGSVQTCMTAEFMLDEREVKQLQELLEKWQQYEGEDGTHPFEHWKIEDVFQTVMEIGSKNTIQRHIKDNQFRFGMISSKQLIDYEFSRDPYTTYTLESEGR